MPSLRRKCRSLSEPKLPTSGWQKTDGEECSNLSTLPSMPRMARRRGPAPWTVPGRRRTLEYLRCSSALMKVPETTLRFLISFLSFSAWKFFSTRYAGQLSLANLRSQHTLNQPICQSTKAALDTAYDLYDTGVVVHMTCQLHVFELISAWASTLAPHTHTSTCAQKAPQGKLTARMHVCCSRAKLLWGAQRAMQ